MGTRPLWSISQPSEGRVGNWNSTRGQRKTLEATLGMKSSVLPFQDGDPHASACLRARTIREMAHTTSECKGTHAKKKKNRHDRRPPPEPDLRSLRAKCSAKFHHISPHFAAPYLTPKHSFVRNTRSPQRRFPVPSCVPPRPRLRRPALPVHRYRRRRRRIGTVLVVPHPVEFEVCPYASYPAILNGCVAAGTCLFATCLLVMLVSGG